MYGVNAFGGWVRTSTEVDKLVPALLAAQKELGAVHKDSSAEIVSKRTGGKFKYTYLSLPRLLEIAKPIYNKHGILIIQGTGGEGKKVRVATRLMHESGQWAETDAGMAAADDGPRAIGSAISYGRRYTFIAITAIAPDDDDDGAAAEGVGRNGAPLAPPVNRCDAFNTAWDKVMKAVGEDDADVVVAMQGAYVYALTKGRTSSLTGLKDDELKKATSGLKAKNKKNAVEWFTSGNWKISAGEESQPSAGPTCSDCGKVLTHGEADACAMMNTKRTYCKTHIAAGKQQEMGE